MPAGAGETGGEAAPAAEAGTAALLRCARHGAANARSVERLEHEFEPLTPQQVPHDGAHGQAPQQTQELDARVARERGGRAEAGVGEPRYGH